MKRSSIKWILIICLVFTVFSITACGSNKPKDLLKGTWVSEKNDILEFHEDGSCVAPFTYNGAWLESADRYTVKDYGTLLLSSAGGHTDSSYELTDSEEEALDNRSQYFVSKETLVIDGDEYTKTE